MGSNLTGWHGLILLLVVLLLFAAPKLPGLARSLGSRSRSSAARCARRMTRPRARPPITDCP